MKTILNVVNGVEVECYDETVGQVARVVIRNSAGHRVVTIMAITTQDGYVSFKQQSLESVSESHVFTVLPGQQFCGAKLSDSFMCCLPSNHKIHAVASGGGG